MKTNLLVIYILLVFTSIFSEEVIERKAKKIFYIPPTDFVTPGFKFFVGGGNASHTHSSGVKHPIEATILINILGKNISKLFNLSGGQFQRDNVIYDNYENYSYFIQPNEKVSPIGKLSSSYTTKSADWTFEISARAKNYNGSYILGNNIPFEYYPGSIEYHWRENQYSIIRNHALSTYLMIQPTIGVREIQENYKRESDNRYANNYSSLREESRTFSQQAGLSFYLKIIENLKFKFTGKIFQPLGGGNLQSVRNDTRIDNGIVYLKNTQMKTKIVNAGGNELEAELSYSLNRFNFFFGYNQTTILKEINLGPGYIPTIVTNENLIDQYNRYFLANKIFETNFFQSENSDPNRGRYQSIKYFYLGLSINF